MRAHGWGGRPPRDADEARARIVAATRRCIAEAGTTSTSEVAECVGVTRQTVYRYFPTTDDLLNAASLDAIVELEARLVQHVLDQLEATGGDAADAAVEVVAYVYEHLRDDPVLRRMIEPGRLTSTVAGLTLPSSIALGRSWLNGLPVDWESIGLGGALQTEFVEHLLRTLQTFVLDPGDPARTGDEVRAYLQRWLAPALRG